MTPTPSVTAAMPEKMPAPASPIFAYGDLGVLSRAVLVLLRQQREQDEQLFTEFGVIVNPKARARMAEIDALLAEIAGWDGRRGELTQEAIVPPREQTLPGCEGNVPGAL